MSFIDVNGLDIPFKDYQAKQVSKFIQDIPKEERERLAEDIEARANLLGCENPKALKVALKHLRRTVE